MRKTWTTPTVTELGSVAELTRQGKIVGGDDGSIFNGQPIGPVTPS